MRPHHIKMSDEHMVSVIRLQDLPRIPVSLHKRLAFYVGFENRQSLDKMSFYRRLCSRLTIYPRYDFPECPVGIIEIKATGQTQ